MTSRPLALCSRMLRLSSLAHKYCGGGHKSSCRFQKHRQRNKIDFAATVLGKKK